MQSKMQGVVMNIISTIFGTNKHNVQLEINSYYMWQAIINGSTSAIHF